LAGSLFSLISRLHKAHTIFRFVLEISVKANSVSASSGTVRISLMSPRVKPTEPAPIMATLIGIMNLKVTGAGNSATGENQPKRAIFCSFLIWEKKNCEFFFAPQKIQRREKQSAILCDDVSSPMRCSRRRSGSCHGADQPARRQRLSDTHRVRRPSSVRGSKVPNACHRAETRRGGSRLVQV
jgi:hypothetical protein